MRNLSASVVSVLVVLSVSVSLFKATSVANNPSLFNSKSKPLETYSSRYALPTNDRSLIAKLPFSFGYRFTDDYGTMQEREEKTDPNGSKTGSYSFVDAAGTYRRVDYIADRHGFRATVRTNEPGTVSGDPAHVSVQIDNDRNVPQQQPAVRNSPQLEYSSHIFSRYNASSGYTNARSRFPAPTGKVDRPNLLFNSFGGNAPERSLPQPDFVKNANFYKGSPFPERASLRPVLEPHLDIDTPLGYPNPKEFGSKFFDNPTYNSDFVFGNKLSKPSYNGDRQPGLNRQPFLTPTRFPRRLRDSRLRGRRKGTEYKVHIPRGFENYPDLPLYRDK